jgi:hypothetical protein
MLLKNAWVLVQIRYAPASTATQNPNASLGERLAKCSVALLLKWQDQADGQVAYVGGLPGAVAAILVQLKLDLQSIEFVLPIIQTLINH